MKLRVGRVAASIVISGILLFGGWFLYQEWAIERPLENLLKGVEGVSEVQLNIQPSELAVKLDLAPGTELGTVVRHLEQDGRKQIGSRKLKIDVVDNSSPVLNELWENAMFAVAQAMENKQYTEITAALEQMEREHAKLKATAEMDNEHVYITLTDGQNSKFVILPRKPEGMGVWPNA
ncbi:hypothetical protein [Paenibacillus sanguinis]|uniref:hypothetical protein n=1 Tax=Paenibacillus sanguinis TaxID=225906 RepID=UPI00036E6FDF|nr:hypothetical protein [Paenibacillus sanguinis]